MELPILSALKDGKTFDFETLADNINDAEKYWKYWWLGRDMSKILRPEVIDANNPILEPTHLKQTADLASHSVFFDKTLLGAIRENCLPSRDGWLRSHYRELLIQMLCNMKSTVHPDCPLIVFSGGGYGSGKTFVLNYLANSKALPLELSHTVGVDTFKLLIPEYHLIKAVGDGRASLTVQKECKELAFDLFSGMVDARRSFIWDSSMSNKDEVVRLITKAKSQGYALKLVAVLTPYEQAIRQAMERAYQTRRFPHPDFFRSSHKGFRDALSDYEPLFDEVVYFSNDTASGHGCCVIAERQKGTNELDIPDEAMFIKAISPLKEGDI